MNNMLALAFLKTWKLTYQYIIYNLIRRSKFVVCVFLEQGSAGSCSYVAHEQLSYAFSVWRMEGEWNNINQE